MYLVILQHTMMAHVVQYMYVRLMNARGKYEPSSGTTSTYMYMYMYYRYVVYYVHTSAEADSLTGSHMYMYIVCVCTYTCTFIYNVCQLHQLRQPTDTCTCM